VSPMREVSRFKGNAGKCCFLKTERPEELFAPGYTSGQEKSHNFLIINVTQAGQEARVVLA
jgi:hypothetical protein